MSGECDDCGEHCLDCRCDEMGMSWINVNEINPPYDVRILLCDANKKVFIGQFRAERDEFNMFEILEWFEDDAGNEIDDNILFWKKLDLAPEDITISLSEYAYLKAKQEHFFELKFRA